MDALDDLKKARIQERLEELNQFQAITLEQMGEIGETGIATNTKSFTRLVVRIDDVALKDVNLTRDVQSVSNTVAVCLHEDAMEFLRRMFKSGSRQEIIPRRVDLLIAGSAIHVSKVVTKNTFSIIRCAGPKQVAIAGSDPRVAKMKATSMFAFLVIAGRKLWRELR